MGIVWSDVGERQKEAEKRVKRGRSRDEDDESWQQKVRGEKRFETWIQSRRRGKGAQKATDECACMTIDQSFMPKGRPIAGGKVAPKTGQSYRPSASCRHNQASPYRTHKQFSQADNRKCSRGRQESERDTHPNQCASHSQRRRGRRSSPAESQSHQTRVRCRTVSASLSRSRMPSTYHKTWSEGRIRRSLGTGSDRSWRRHATTDSPHALAQTRQNVSVVHPRSFGHPGCERLLTAMTAAVPPTQATSGSAATSRPVLGIPVARVVVH